MHTRAICTGLRLRYVCMARNQEIGTHGTAGLRHGACVHMSTQAGHLIIIGEPLVRRV